MDKQEHGRQLKAAMARQGLDRQAICDVTGVQPRTVTNWTTGATMPSLRELEILERVLGRYTSEGDEVEAAIERSPLVKWRRRDVLTTYEKHLHEQQSLGEVREA